jgi:hypothetical protein
VKLTATLEGLEMNKPNTTIDFGDARFLKRAGMPPNTSMTDLDFSREYCGHFTGLINAHDRLMISVMTCFDSGAAKATPSEWRLIKRRLAGFNKAIRGCEAFTGKLSRGELPFDFKSDQDCIEYMLLSGFLFGRAIPFAEYWQSAIDEVDNGTPLTIRPDDIPKWFDEE